MEKTDEPVSTATRPRRRAIAVLAAYLLTAVEAGLLAGVLVVGARWQLASALPFGCLVALPLLPAQAWALCRMRHRGPPTPRTSSRSREALLGLATTLGFLLTIPIVLLLAAIVAGALLTVNWAVELAGSPDVIAAIEAKGAAAGDLATLPRWVLVATAATCFAGLGGLGVAWTAILGRLRGLRWRPGLKDGLAFRAPRRHEVLAAIVGGLAVGWVPSLIADALARSPGYLQAVRGLLGPPTSLAWLDATLQTGTLPDRVGMALVVTLLGPLAEELVFRGFLWTALERWLPPAVVLVATTLLFALAHLDPVHTPAVLFVGAFLGWLRLTSGSIVPSLLTHAVNNTLGVAIAWRGVHGVPEPLAWALGGLTIAVAAVLWASPGAARYRLA